MVRLVNPTGMGTDASREAAQRLQNFDGKRIGLLVNGKANSEQLLRETAAFFVDSFGCEITHFLDKKNASRPAPTEFITELAEQSDFLITAVGD